MRMGVGTHDCVEAAPAVIRQTRASSSEVHTMIQESDVGQWLAIRKEAGLKINPSKFHQSS